jgi:hypothetical protein
VLNTLRVVWVIFAAAAATVAAHGLLLAAQPSDKPAQPSQPAFVRFGCDSEVYALGHWRPICSHPRQRHRNWVLESLYLHPFKHARQICLVEAHLDLHGLYVPLPKGLPFPCDAFSIDQRLGADLIPVRRIRAPLLCKQQSCEATL